MSRKYPGNDFKKRRDGLLHRTESVLYSYKRYTEPDSAQNKLLFYKKNTKTIIYKADSI